MCKVLPKGRTQPDAAFAGMRPLADALGAFGPLAPGPEVRGVRRPRLVGLPRAGAYTDLAEVPI